MCCFRAVYFSYYSYLKYLVFWKETKISYNLPKRLNKDKCHERWQKHLAKHWTTANKRYTRILYATICQISRHTNDLRMTRYLALEFTHPFNRSNIKMLISWELYSFTSFTSIHVRVFTHCLRRWSVGRYLFLRKSFHYQESQCRSLVRSVVHLFLRLQSHSDVVVARTVALSCCRFFWGLVCRHYMYLQHSNVAHELLEANVAWWFCAFSFVSLWFCKVLVLVLAGTI